MLKIYLIWTTKVVLLLRGAEDHLTVPLDHAARVPEVGAVHDALGVGEGGKGGERGGSQYDPM